MNKEEEKDISNPNVEVKYVNTNVRILGIKNE